MKRLLPLVAIIALTAACSSNKPEPNTPSSGEPAHQLTPSQQDAIAQAQEHTGGGVTFDDEILRLCPGIKAPKFAYDSAVVKAQFREALVGLAACMKDGGLKDRNLLLVGHADPRGEEDYNLALGGRRANSVRDAMRELGVASGRFQLTSRGDLDAKGTDEATWAEDRRVDVKLASR